jgi:hypothetical protein
MDGWMDADLAVGMHWVCLCQTSSILNYGQRYGQFGENGSGKYSITSHPPHPILSIRLILPSSNPSQNATSTFHRTLTSTSPVMGLNPLCPRKGCEARKRIEYLSIADDIDHAILEALYEELE